MAIILSSAFEQGQLGLVPGLPAEQPPVPPVHFHTPGKIPSFVIVPLIRETAEIRHADGREDTLTIDIMQTFAVDADQVDNWVRKGHLNGISADNETEPGIACIFPRRALAQERVDQINQGTWTNYLDTLRRVEQSGATIIRQTRFDVSHHYDDLAVLPAGRNFAPLTGHRLNQ